MARVGNLTWGFNEETFRLNPLPPLPVFSSVKGKQFKSRGSLTALLKRFKIIKKQ